MSRWIRWLSIGVAASVLCLAVAIAADVLLWPDATVRLARHFQLADVATANSIQAGLAARVPLGTPENDVYAFLTKSGIGKSPLSSFDTASREGVVVCRIEYDPSTLVCMKGYLAYVIHFRLDEQRALRAIEVHRSMLRL